VSPARRVLLHACCGPCLIHPAEDLRAGGVEPTALFYNPNIQPYQEYVKRRDAAAEAAEALGVELITLDEYDLAGFLRGVVFREEQRCRICYHQRLSRAASVAKRGGFDAFTTTLSVSPTQSPELIQQVGEAVSAETGVAFLYRDWRPGYSAAAARSRELGLYRQQYCGCIYSEYERFGPKGGKP